MAAQYLVGLNPAQLQAVEHHPQIPLQILAGPGSGKTKVLTSRIAHFISHHSISPSSICAVTFTNKAANEMRERLTKIIGKERTGLIKMGTFHSLCARFLRSNGKLIGLEGNFTVCDAEESKKIINKLLKPYEDQLAAVDITLKDTTVMSMISKAKAKGRTPEDILADANSKSAGDLIQQVVGQVYQEYQYSLRKSNSLDFDDLLVFGVALFRDNSKVAKWCKHVLVDEFQDTNTMQYELMRHIASASRCVTIVGDPDQSIYGWRSAEVENLARMKRDFPSTIQILLEHNYRSTASILATSVAIVSEDKTRIPKTLHTTHANGPRPSLQAFPSEQMEADFIAHEIKRLNASSGGMLKWGDFVVLLRMNSLSRKIESALQKEGIPSRVLAGHKFFERLEVKDVLAYLQLVDNPQYVPAFTRVINVPSRAIGEKTINQILLKASSLGISPLETVERIHDGKIPDTKPPVKRKLATFIQPIRTIRKMAKEGEYPSDLIRELIELIEYQDHLKKTQKDYDSRWDNVQELINYASEMEEGGQILAIDPLDAAATEDEEDWIDSQADFDRDMLYVDGFAEVKSPASASRTNGVQEGGVDRKVIRAGLIKGETPLRQFLQASMLSTDTETQGGEEDKDKVTISTCHAAKGLEWPVVFIPALEKGIFPSARAEDIEEERRLLYVACTRAQGLLYLTHATSRMFAGEVMKKELSELISVLKARSPNLFMINETPILKHADLVLLAKVIGRDPPNQGEITRAIQEHEHSRTSRAYPIHVHNVGVCRNGYQMLEGTANSNNTSYQGQGQGYPAAAGPSRGTRSGPAAFKSARAVSPGPSVPPQPPSKPQSKGTSKPTPRAPFSPSKNTVINVQAVLASRGMTAHQQASASNSKGKQRASAIPSAGQTKLFSYVKRESSSPEVEVVGYRPAPLPATLHENAASSVRPATRKLHSPERSVPTAKRTVRSYLPAVTPTLVTQPSSSPPSFKVVPPNPSNPSTSSSSEVSQSSPDPNSSPVSSEPVKLGGGKRRLGMGRTVVGYPNKKFKKPT